MLVNVEKNAKGWIIFTFQGEAGRLWTVVYLSPNEMQLRMAQNSAA
jgi:hypothetical protein